MDINDLRITVTVLGLVLFLSLVRWAYSRRQRAGFDEAAQLPFLDESTQKPTHKPLARREKDSHE